MTEKASWRRGKFIWLVAALALSLAIGSSDASAIASNGRTVVTTPILGAGQTGPRSAVPWRQVGPGWVLAEYWPGQFLTATKPAAVTLYLYDPAGGRYRLYRWPATKMPPFLVDWSGDKTRALISKGQVVEQIILATGKVTRFRLARGVQPIGYTRPRGQELLGWRQVGGYRTRISRYRLNGRLAKVLVAYSQNISVVYSGDGATLAAGAAHGLRLVSNRTGVLRMLPVPGVNAGCFPSRWWNSTNVLASCEARKTSRDRLWLVPVNGRKPKPLIAQGGTHSPDVDAIDAWRVRGRLYLQALTPAGYGRIFRQAGDGQLERVTVPGTTGDNWIGTPNGSRLLIFAQNPCSDHTSLLWFNPVTRHEQVLINAPHGLTGVAGAVAYGPPVASILIAVGCVGRRTTDRSHRL